LVHLARLYLYSLWKGENLIRVSLGSTPVCSNGSPQALPFTTTINPAAICGQPIGSVSSEIVQLQKEYQAATLAAGPQSNASFIGSALADGIDVTGTNLFCPRLQNSAIRADEHRNPARDPAGNGVHRRLPAEYSNPQSPEHRYQPRRRRALL
jgi:hypothetical protein